MQERKESTVEWCPHCQKMSSAIPNEGELITSYECADCSHTLRTEWVVAVTTEEFKQKVKKLAKEKKLK